MVTKVVVPDDLLFATQQVLHAQPGTFAYGLSNTAAVVDALTEVANCPFAPETVLALLNNIMQEPERTEVRKIADRALEARALLPLWEQIYREERAGRTPA